MPTANSSHSSNDFYLNKQSSISDARDAQRAYFAGRSGLVDTASRKHHNEDHMLATLNALGYNTGTLNDRLIAFYRTKTGLNSRNIGDLANAFFSTPSGHDFV